MKMTRKILATLAATIVATFGAFSFQPLAAFAEGDSASSSMTSTVLEDLQKDVNFSIDDYPSQTVEEVKAAKKELLQVVQIAEGANGELFVYVYQPTDETKEIVATYINIAKSTSDDAKRVYPLELVSTEGTLDKYRVKNFTFREATDRYYEIPEIFRGYDADLDVETGNDNKDSNIAVDVSQKWRVITVDGTVQYFCEKLETMKITSSWYGSISYANGIEWFDSSVTESHFVAFTTNREIDKLESAQVFYTEKTIVIEGTFATGHDVKTKVVSESGKTPHEEKIEGTEKGGNNPSDWLGGITAHQYEWPLISTIEQFIASEGDYLSEEAKAKLQEIYTTAGTNGAFVLRYAQTHTTVDIKFVWKDLLVPGLIWTTAECTRTLIGDATIVELNFIYNGTPYSLGVVGNMTTSDNIPDGNHSFMDGIRENIKDTTKELRRMMRLIGLVFGAVLLVALVALLVYGVAKLVTWVRMNKFFKNNGGGSGKPPIDKGGGSG